MSKWLKLSEATPGLRVKVDDGFDCVLANQEVTIEKDLQGLYFPCAHGHHYLAGQADDGEHCIGVYAP